MPLFSISRKSYTIQSFRNSWLSTTTRKTKTFKLSRWKKLSSPYRLQWPLEKKCSEHRFMILVLWTCRYQNLWFCSPVFLLWQLHLSRLNYFSSSIFSYKTYNGQLSSDFLVHRGRTRSVCYILRQKKKRCLQLTDSAICTYQLQMKKVSEVATNTPIKYFKLNKNIKNNTVFL